MAGGVKQCPVCASALSSEYRGKLITWECSNGHGIGLNIFEAVGYLQRDEIDAIWQGSAGAPPSKYQSPVDGRPMVKVTFMADDDLEYDSTVGDAWEMTVDLDPQNYFAWFEGEGLESMPTMHGKRTPKTTASMVNLGDLDKGEDPYEKIFKDASAYSQEPVDNGLVNMLGGLARRLSVR